MKKLICIFNALPAIACLLTMGNMAHGMNEEKKPLIIIPEETFQLIREYALQHSNNSSDIAPITNQNTIIDTKNENSFYGSFGLEPIYNHSPQRNYAKMLFQQDLTQQAQENEQYNFDHSLPQDILSHIFSCCCTQDNDEAKALKEALQHFMTLKRVCKKFNKLLSYQVISNYCKNYTLEAKNKVFQNVINSMNDLNYNCMRLPVLILIHSGADANTKSWDGDSVLREAFRVDDIELASLLFQHNVDPNSKNLLDPIFFRIGSKKMAKLCVDNNVNIHTLNSFNENVLWWIVIDNRFPSDLMNFYLEHNVNAKLIQKHSGDCLLHKLASSNIEGIKNLLKKAQLLLNAIPEMINYKNNNKQTPLDLAYKALERATKYKFNDEIKILKKLIKLFKANGALTSEELKQRTVANNTIQETTDQNCIICFEKQPNMIDLPCPNKHKDPICLECYTSHLKTSNKCPLCRAKLTK